MAYGLSPSSSGSRRCRVGRGQNGSVGDSARGEVVVEIVNQTVNDCSVSGPPVISRCVNVVRWVPENVFGWIVLKIISGERAAAARVVKKNERLGIIVPKSVVLNSWMPSVMDPEYRTKRGATPNIYIVAN